MRRTRFNEGSSFRPKVNKFAELGGMAAAWEPATLPHDAMIGTPRSPSASGANAYFPGGVWEYSTTLDVTIDDADEAVILEFEGVYRDAVVYVNGSFAAQRPHGYSLFRVPIDHLLQNGSNDIRVECRALEDTAWYSGAGIYRNVWLLSASRVHIGPDGPVVRHRRSTTTVQRSPWPPRYSTGRREPPGSPFGPKSSMRTAMSSRPTRRRSARTRTTA